MSQIKSLKLSIGLGYNQLKVRCIGGVWARACVCVCVCEHVVCLCVCVCVCAFVCERALAWVQGTTGACVRGRV